MTACTSILKKTREISKSKMHILSHGYGKDDLYVIFHSRSLIEWFSIECRKTRKKAISLTNHKKGRQHSKPAPSARKCERAKLAIICCASHWLRKWREFCQPITEQSKVNPKQTKITFDVSIEKQRRMAGHY